MTTCLFPWALARLVECGGRVQWANSPWLANAHPLILSLLSAGNEYALLTRDVPRRAPLASSIKPWLMRRGDSDSIQRDPDRLKQRSETVAGLIV